MRKPQKKALNDRDAKNIKLYREETAARVLAN